MGNPDEPAEMRQEQQPASIRPLEVSTGGTPHEVTYSLETQGARGAWTVGWRVGSGSSDSA